MKIGLYLAYAPFPPKSSLKNEGLGRYLALLIQNFLNDGHTVVLACPNWMKDILSELLEDYALPMAMDRLEMLTTKLDPLLLKLYYKLKSDKKKYRPKWRGRLSQVSDRFFEWMLNILLSIKSILFLVALIIFALTVGILCLPLVLGFLAVTLILKICNWIGTKVFKINRSVTVIGVINKFFSLPGISIIHRKVRYILDHTDIRELFRENAARELLKRIDMLKEPPEIWYSPTAFWSEFGDINGVAVTCIPDLVINEFPLEFAQNSNSKIVSERLRKTVKNNRYFITYCEYIKESVLVNQFGVEPERIKPIMMFTNEMGSYIDVQGSYPYHSNANEIFARMFLLDMAREFLYNSVNPGYMASNVWFSLKDVKYLFYSSQVRYHKNILNLVKAYEYLLRKEKITCKLFLTGKYTDNAQLCQYIIENRLQNDVLCFHDVPNLILAALYACAELCVNPTLYEGGFPFTLSEGMSVGTPSVMSRIPQVTEFTKGWGLDDCLFDPYDYKDIADKILYGLDNRAKLVERQKPLYQNHSKRTTSGQAGKEYVEAFKYFIELDKTMEKTYVKKK